MDLHKSLKGNKEEFKQLVKSLGADESDVDHINFINKEDVRASIMDIGDYEIIDLMENNPLADIDFIIKKVRTL